MKRIIIVGAGFGGVKAFQTLSRLFRADEEVEVLLINDVNYFLFTPLLHEVATGALSPENIIVPLAPLAAAPRRTFIATRLVKVLSAEKKIVTQAGDFTYDYLILCLGSQVNFYDTPGAKEHSYPLKDLDDAARIKNRIIKQFAGVSCLKTAAERRAALTFVIVGGGATGVELSGELADFCCRTFAKLYEPAIINLARIVMIQREASVLPQFSDGLRRRSLAALGRKGVEVMTNTAVESVAGGSIKLSTGETINAETIIWTAGVKPHVVAIEPPLKVDRDKLIVNDYLATNNPAIFALGDASLVIDQLSNQPLPMLAQVADRQAKYLARHLFNLINNKPVKTFHYHSQGHLVSVGSWWAVGDILGLHITGRLTWILWRGVYFFKMPTLSKKLQIALDWFINSFKPRDVSLLPFTTKDIHK